jgi:hypothetical protein
MKNKTSKYLIMTITGLLSFFASCKKDKDLVPVPQPVQNEAEVITTLKITLVDSANSSNIATATFRDPDGDGGVGPDIFDTIVLQPNKTYYATIVLLNELALPVDTISNEVAEEANDHQFFFVYNTVSVTHTYLDSDTNIPPFPLGLSTKWKTGAIGNGTSQIILKHQPGIKDGNITTGETDIDITFQTKIQ